MLASSGAAGISSVVQLRGGDLRPEVLAPLLIATVSQRWPASLNQEP